jgi:hypothetical protein
MFRVLTLKRKPVCPHPNHKKCAKIFFCKHWKQLLVDAVLYEYIADKYVLK